MAKTDKPETTFYLVLLQDDKLGIYSPESELLSKKVAIQRLTDGEWDHSPLVRVVEITVGEPSRDVTEDFLREIYSNLLEDGETCPDWLFGAMEEHRAVGSGCLRRGNDGVGVAGVAPGCPEAHHQVR